MRTRTCLYLVVDEIHRFEMPFSSWRGDGGYDNNILSIRTFVKLKQKKKDFLSSRESRNNSNKFETCGWALQLPSPILMLYTTLDGHSYWLFYIFI